MAKENKNTIETLEQALEVIAQKDALIVDLNKSIELKDAQIVDLNKSIELKDQEIAVLNDSIDAKDQEIEDAKATAAAVTKEVPGTYTSKLHKITVKFKKGFVNTRYKGGIVPSAELIKNEGGKYTEFLDHLIDIKFGGFEVVKKK